MLGVGGVYKKDLNFMFQDASIKDAEFIGRVRNNAAKYMIDQKTVDLTLQHKWFSQQHKRFYIIIVNKHKIGYVSYDKKRKEIGICLLPKWRNKGYGTKAFSELISRLPRPLHLRTLTSNKRAIKVYEKLGFITTQVRGNITYMKLSN